MDKRRLRKILKPMLASFAYQDLGKFVRFFEIETDATGFMSAAQQNRIVAVLKEYAGGDLMEPDYD